MRITKQNQRTFFWLSETEFSELEEKTPDIEKISYSALNDKGYLNLILDFPTGKFIAVLDEELEKLP